MKRRRKALRKTVEALKRWKIAGKGPEGYWDLEKNCFVKFSDSWLAGKPVGG